MVPPLLPLLHPTIPANPQYQIYTHFIFHLNQQSGYKDITFRLSFYGHWNMTSWKGITYHQYDCL
eukprot:15328657-Ditylum_brightwellii.AAC.1